MLEIYNKKKIFLTGHTGFKGSWMLSWLKILGATVKGYSLAPEKQSLFCEIKGEELCESVIGDIRDKEKLKKEILAFEPDFVFHLAAQPLVRVSYEIPSETLEVNAIGTAYLLDAIRLLEKPCSIIIITTDKVYQNNEWIYPYRETDSLGGYDPYSASKAVAELIVTSYKNSFFNPNSFSTHQKGIVTARAGNVIGGGDWAKDRIIPDIIRALKQDNPVIIRNPTSVRPWQHVLEPLYGYLLLGRMLAQNGKGCSDSWNFGPHAHDCLSVEDLIKTAISRWGKGTYEIKQHSDQLHEANLLMLDISKAINQLHWRPKYTAPKAIELTIDWYHSNENALALVEKQINDYIRL